MSWQLLVVILAGLWIGGLVLLVLFARSPRSHRTRLGVFLERDILEHDDDDEG